MSKKPKAIKRFASFLSVKKRRSSITQLIDYEYVEKITPIRPKKPFSFKLPNFKKLLGLPWLKKGRKHPKPKLESKKLTPLVLEKPDYNPIISPREENFWESWQVFNPGAVLLEDSVHLIYRSIGGDGVSRFGYASTKDGFNIHKRLSYPVYEHSLLKGYNPIFYNGSGGSWGGCEDPRLVRVDDDRDIYMLYTALDGGLRMAITSIDIDDFLSGKWKWRPPKLISPPGINQKNWVLFPERINGKYAILHSLSPKVSIEYRDNLDFDDGEYIISDFDLHARRESGWDSWVRGAGPPPIKTKYGWLLFYHAMDINDPSKYKVGAKILDLDDPTKILFRSKEPILEPNEIYENEGFKSGVVYASGAIVKDSVLLIYYGGSDSYVCVAYTNFDKFLEALIRDKKTGLIRKAFKKISK